MADYRRWYVPGGTYFFTVVTYRRHPLAEVAMASARHKASDNRQRRQVEKLAAAVRYWGLAAELLQLSAEAGRLKNSGPQEALVVLRRAVDEKWPQLAAQLRAMPPGRAGVLLPRTWQRVVEPMKKTLQEQPAR